MALKLGYLGTSYHGFQIQPDRNLPTIEGALFRAFSALELFEFESRQSAHYSAAGRTDKGVHALAQVVSFDTTREVTPRMINSMLPDDIWVYAIARPPPDFDARRDAVSRIYRYFLFAESEPHEPSLSLSRMQDAAELLTGTHDFSNFAQRERRGHEPGSESCIREIKRIEVEKEGSFIIIEVEANSFLRKMVRKIVSALCMVGRGERDKGWLESLLDTQSRLKEGIEPASPHGLVLREVVYHTGVEFAPDRYVMKRMEERLRRDLALHATITRVLRDMVGL